jgi:hypothetical protein
MLKTAGLIFILFVASCNEPETVVTDYVHTDGSVTREIKMKSIAEKAGERFRLSDIQVPLDSTWNVKDSAEINVKGDTVWVRRAKKFFRNTDEINLTYRCDSGANRKALRKALFERKFRWFNTVYRFSEQIDKRMTSGYPVTDFLDNEELLCFYTPDYLRFEKENGPDSLKYKALGDSVSKKVELWNTRNLVSGWIDEFTKMSGGKSDEKSAPDSLKTREDELVSLIRSDEKKFDSLWTNGVILKKFLGGTDYEKFKPAADSAAEKIAQQIWTDFREYSVRIVMPGKLTGSNGFFDSCKVLLWPVRSDYFTTETYEMWAESVVPNSWAWIISGLFVAFVLSGFLIKLKRLNF